MAGRGHIALGKETLAERGKPSPACSHRPMSAEKLTGSSASTWRPKRRRLSAACARSPHIPDQRLPQRRQHSRQRHRSPVPGPSLPVHPNHKPSWRRQGVESVASSGAHRLRAKPVHAASESSYVHSFRDVLPVKSSSGRLRSISLRIPTSSDRLLTGCRLAGARQSP